MIEQSFRSSNNRTAREAWLEARRTCLGASDSPSILGIGYSSQSAWSVWDSKVLPQPDNTDTPFSWEIGLAVEETVAKLYETLTGNIVRVNKSPTLCRHDQHSFIGASLDGWAVSNSVMRPLEIKNVGQHNAAEWGPCPRCSGVGCGLCDDGKLTPIKYIVQVQHQLLVTGCEAGVLVALIGGQRIEHRTIKRDDAFLDALLAELIKFWRLVEIRTPPPPDSSEAANKVLHKLYPSATPGSCVALPPRSGEALAAWEAAKSDEKEAAARKRAAEAALKLSIGDAEYGATDDGRYVRWERHEIQEATVTRKAHTRHQLRVIKRLPKGIAYVDSSTDRERIEAVASDQG